MYRNSLRYAECPLCGEVVYFHMTWERQGEPPYWVGWAESLDEIEQCCSCPLTEKELDELFDTASEWEPSPNLPDD